MAALTRQASSRIKRTSGPDGGPPERSHLILFERREVYAVVYRPDILDAHVLHSDTRALAVAGGPHQA